MLGPHCRGDVLLNEDEKSHTPSIEKTFYPQIFRMKRGCVTIDTPSLTITIILISQLIPDAIMLF